MAMARAESSGVPRPLAGGHVFPGWLKRDVLMVSLRLRALLRALFEEWLHESREKGRGSHMGRPPHVGTPPLATDYPREHAGSAGAVKYRARLKGDRDEHVSHEPSSIPNQARDQLAACG